MKTKRTMKILKTFLNQSLSACCLLLLSFMDPLIIEGKSAALKVEESQTAGQRLASDVMRNYSKLVRPVTNPNLPVNVHMRMNLYQLLDVAKVAENWKAAQFSIATKFFEWKYDYSRRGSWAAIKRWVLGCNQEYWTDQFLGWDPRNYENVKLLVLPWDQVWLPDTCLYNSLDVNRASTERWISVIYTPRQAAGGEEGVIEERFDESRKTSKDSGKNEERHFVADGIFQYPAIYTFTCKMNIRLFPFDLQRCIMTFSSWTHDSSGIDYHLKDNRPNVTFESYTENEEWVVKEFNFRRKPIHYDCCPIPYTLLEAELVIQRKPLYYITNLVIPTTIITLIAVVGFFMPASTNSERTEKISLGITTLLAMSILLLMVSDQMPTTSDYIPLMGWYFLLIIFIISIGTFTTSIIILIHSRGNSGIPPSRALIGAFHKIGACLFVGQTKEYQRVSSKKKMIPHSMTMTTSSSSSSSRTTKRATDGGGDVVELDKNGNPTTIVVTPIKNSVEIMKDSGVEIPLLNLNGENGSVRTHRRSSIRSCRGGEHGRSSLGSSSQTFSVDYIDASFQTHAQLMALAGVNPVGDNRVGTPNNPATGYCNDQYCTNMRQNDNNNSHQHHQMNQTANLVGGPNSMTKPRPNTLSKSENLRRIAATAPLASMEATPASLSSSLILQLMCDILNTLRVLQSVLAAASADDSGWRQHHKTGITMLEWAYVCAVLDRICLILFTMIVLTLTSTTILYGWLCRDRMYANHDEYP